MDRKKTTKFFEPDKGWILARSGMYVHPWDAHTSLISLSQKYPETLDPIEAWTAIPDRKKG
ncbi:hypothetical protein [uncultured Hyphomonas sp.]|uniref:hypothetical protein n=1 Tax=uncultured Hyphomonas sp. TaxID=225298 RepID=UPI002AAB2ABA|nr:hypothetical protein [uncultured Hyphomonas sp.]